MTQWRLWWMRKISGVNKAEAKELKLYYIGMDNCKLLQWHKTHIWIDSKGRKYRSRVFYK